MLQAKPQMKCQPQMSKTVRREIPLGLMIIRAFVIMLKNNSYVSSHNEKV